MADGVNRLASKYHQFRVRKVVTDVRIAPFARCPNVLEAREGIFSWLG